MATKVRVFLYRGFLSEKECDHLISLRKETSEVKSGDADGKTQLVSSEYVLDVPDPIVAGIEEKISAWTFLPRENSSPIKVRSYTSENSGNKLDYFGEDSSSVWDESLLATIILYVSNITQGGELLFPYSEVKTKQSWSDCSQTGNSLRPVKGNAVLFFTRHLNTSLDQTSTHFRCPVLKGKLLVATKLIYAKKQARNDDNESGECSDEDENCGQWAQLGECKKNPVYMIGSPDYFDSNFGKSMELVKQDGNDSLDMLIRRAVGKDPLLSFHRPESSPVQLFQLLHSLERPGWPLLTPLKIQLHKCEKCTREFCSPVNFRRHKRMHRRSTKPEKYSGKERDALGAFWDKLSVVDAKEILSLKSRMLEIKAWLADKDAEALRCQNLLVEEEEAAQRRQAELLERKKRKKLRQKEQRVKDQTKDAKEDESTTSEEQQQSPAESSSALSVASDSEAQRSDSIPVEDSSSLDEPQVLEMDNGRNSETQAPMVDDDGFGNGQNMERRSDRREMERSQYGLPNGFHGNHAPKLGVMRKNGTNRDVRASTTKVWSRKADNPKSISPDAVVAEQEQTKNSEVLIGSVSVTIQNSCLSREQNQAKCSEEEGRTEAVEAKPTSEQSTVEVSRPLSSQGRKVSTDKKDKHSSSTAPEVKTAHHIGLQFNNHEAKAFLAKRWKEAISSEHVTLVLSQETDMPGNNTHESSNGVITAARPKHRMKPEKGTKVKYVPKQKIP
ncbi:hypothetical protein Bca4012_023130 [Brassica carinata]